ncbi:MAG: hypothetical protein NC829_02980, partial [Candidatus Omnitrophica bacterium]|nr:hypothetical protein [Candidatus Omnitrophota bacterium]
EPEFALADFEKKNELFIYDIERTLPVYPAEPIPKLENILDFWQKVLHIYCVRHFFPLDYERLSFDQIGERFYALKVEVEEDNQNYLIRFILPDKYGYKNDLEYTLKRINQKHLQETDGKRLWFI